MTDAKRFVIIRIEDEGEGIEVSEIKILFRRFHRGSTSKTGYGIGLAMAKDIIEAHHGSVTAGNRGNAGAWFEIKLLMLENSNVFEVQQ